MKIFIILVILGIFLGGQVLALETSWPTSPFGTNLNEELQTKSRQGIPVFINYLYEWLVVLGGLAVFISFFIAGFQYLTSAGAPSQMGAAMDRMKSAGLGLILLLGSVLILNTINPQLTQLKMPTADSTSLNLPSIPMPPSLGEKCQGVEIFSGYNSTTGSGSGSSIKMRGPESSINYYFTASSVLFSGGSCHLALYPYNNFAENADEPATYINSTTTEATTIRIQADNNRTSFGSAKLINLGF